MTHPTEERLKVALTGKYEIVQKLGEGGMAVVYLATDLKHGRKVAVKILRPELASALGPDRFLREIQVTAGLSHPHILPLYDSGEADGFLYYVMPYMPGESLSDLIKRERQLSLEDAIRIGREVAEGLGHAHSHGLIHRDIKPENIMLSGGHAVIADFGISRAVSEAGGDKLTQTGMAIGTPAYMAPEQAAGDTNLDGRADVYALGCVLYEMLIGDVPFTGPTPLAVMARHTMDHLTPPSIMRDSIPPELEDVIFCAMAKTPADRFRTAAEMAEALGAVGSGGLAKVRKTAAHLRHTAAMRSVPRPPGWRRPAMATGLIAALAISGLIGWQVSQRRNAPAVAAAGTHDLRQIAVLYFRDLTGQDMGHVADGITEGLINQLSQVPTLNVISRNGVEPFRDGAIARDSIASILGAGTIIDGSIEAQRNSIRVTAHLVDGESGGTIRSESFALPPDQLLAVQDSAVGEVSRILREWLGEEVRVRTQRTRARSAAAWTLLQRAEKQRKDAVAAFAERPSAAVGHLLAADSILADAEDADPEWVDPPLVRGEVSLTLASISHGVDEQQDWLDSAIGHAARASQLDGSDPRVLTLEGRLSYERWDRDTRIDPANADALLETAENKLDAAVRADPNNALAHATLYYVHYAKKDVVSAVLEARLAYEADAYLRNAPTIVNQLFSGFYDNEQFREARRWCAEGERRFPSNVNFTRCALFLMLAPDATPDIDTAWRLAARVDSLTSSSPGAEFDRRLARILAGGIIGRAGQADSAETVLRNARASAEIDPTQELMGFEAVVRTILGQQDRALELLRAYVAANPHHSFEVGGNIHWWWRPLRANPEFQDVMELRR